MHQRLHHLLSCSFNTQPPEGGCCVPTTPFNSIFLFQHTAARRRLLFAAARNNASSMVSTHSRPKAAASDQIAYFVKSWCFNTQPPEGGCLIFQSLHLNYQRFNTQPPEGGCIIKRHIKYKVKGFNTQPPEGGCYF